MPAKKKTVKKAVKKVVKVFADAVSAPVEKVGKMNWSNVVKTEMKKPRSWADWSARQLDENKGK